MRKVLIVDDNKDLLEMVDLALARQGYYITTLTGGTTFFNTVASFKPDIILLDIFLGDADGRRLCLELKLQPAYRDIPVILYSAGHVSLTSVEDSQADQFIQKPFDINFLSEKIKNLLPV